MPNIELTHVQEKGQIAIGFQDDAEEIPHLFRAIVNLFNDQIKVLTQTKPPRSEYGV